MGQSWIGIRVSAGLAILGGALMLLFAGLMLATAFFGQLPQNTDAPNLPYKPLLIGIAVFFAALSAWGISTGICIILRQRWARISILVFAVLLTFTSAGGALSVLFIQLPATPGAEAYIPIVKWGIAGLYCVFTAIGVWWLVLFNRASARAYFAGQGPAVESGRPLSISFIAWFLLIGVAFMAVAAILRFPAVLFGFVITGWATLAVYTVYAAAQLYLGTALLQLREEGRLGAIGYSCFFALSGGVTLLRLGNAELTRRILAAMPRFFPADTPITPMPAWITAVFTAVVCALPIFFLVKRRAAFTQP